jgi:hypothetical protein
LHTYINANINTFAYTHKCKYKLTFAYMHKCKYKLQPHPYLARSNFFSRFTREPGAVSAVIVSFNPRMTDQWERDLSYFFISSICIRYD